MIFMTYYGFSKTYYSLNIISHKNHNKSASKNHHNQGYNFEKVET